MEHGLSSTEHFATDWTGTSTDPVLLLQVSVESLDEGCPLITEMTSPGFVVRVVSVHVVHQPAEPSALFVTHLGKGSLYAPPSRKKKQKTPPPIYGLIAEANIMISFLTDTEGFDTLGYFLLGGVAHLAALRFLGHPVAGSPSLSGLWTEWFTLIGRDHCVADSHWSRSRHKDTAQSTQGPLLEWLPCTESVIGVLIWTKETEKSKKCSGRLFFPDGWAEGRGHQQDLGPDI